MKKLWVTLGLLLVVLVATYFYFFAPSLTEREGDKLYQAQNYAGSMLQYTRALASKPPHFKAERLLFKLGNSARQSGQRERATDFYFKILRDNPDSIYRDRIQSFLRLETQDFKEQSLSKPYQLNLESLRQGKVEGLSELKQQRDRLYSHLVMALSRMDGGMNFEVKSLYRDFKMIETEFNSKLESVSLDRPQKARKRLERRLAIVGFPTETADALRKHESVFSLRVMEASNISELFAKGGEQIPQSVFMSIQGVNHTNFSLNLRRLLDYSEKTKIFLLIDDNEGEGIGDGLPEPLPTRVHILRCRSGEVCRQEIQNVMHSRHLWQSNGSTI